MNFCLNLRKGEKTVEEKDIKTAAENGKKEKIAPVSPAIAATLLLAVVFAIYAFSYRGSGVALSLAPALPVLAIFGAGAFAYTTLKSTPFAIISACLTAAVIAGISFLCKIDTADELRALASLPAIALLGGATMGICTRKKASMKTTVMLSAAVPCIAVAAIVLIHSYTVTGAPFKTLKVALSQAREETVALMEESMAQMKELGYESALNIEALINETFNVLPGTLIAMVVVLSYLMQKTMIFVARLFGSPSDIPEETKNLEITVVAAIVYTITLALSLFLPAGMAQAASHNIALCFVPALALVGVKTQFAQRRGGVVRIGCLPIIIFAFLFYMNPALAVKVLALFGAFEIVGQALNKVKKS